MWDKLLDIPRLVFGVLSRPASLLERYRALPRGTQAEIEKNSLRIFGYATSLSALFLYAAVLSGAAAAIGLPAVAGMAVGVVFGALQLAGNMVAHRLVERHGYARKQSMAAGMVQKSSRFLRRKDFSHQALFAGNIVTGFFGLVAVGAGIASGGALLPLAPLILTASACCLYAATNVFTARIAREGRIPPHPVLNPIVGTSSASFVVALVPFFTGADLPRLAVQTLQALLSGSMLAYGAAHNQRDPDHKKGTPGHNVETYRAICGAQGVIGAGLLIVGEWALAANRACLCVSNGCHAIRETLYRSGYDPKADAGKTSTNGGPFRPGPVERAYPFRMRP